MACNLIGYALSFLNSLLDIVFCWFLWLAEDRYSETQGVLYYNILNKLNLDGTI